MAGRRGGWIQTYTLRQFWPLDPRAEDVCIDDIDDIAHALSMQCRFSGHIREFYSVADHSVRVSLLAEQLMLDSGVSPDAAKYAARWGLLHDAAEAYLVDLPSPVKRTPEMTPYREAERQLIDVICQRFGLHVFEPISVKQADRTLLATEARDLFAGLHPEWHVDDAPLAAHIRPVSPSTAKAVFLSRFGALFPEVSP